jgi:hypothetical protein
LKGWINLSENFKDKLKAYVEGRLSDEDKALMDKELEKLEQYQEFLDEQSDINSGKRPDLQESVIGNQEKIIRKSKWKARIQNACITWVIFWILVIILQTLTAKYYSSGNPSKETLYRNAIRASVQSTIPNANIYQSSSSSGLFFSRTIGIKYSKKVGTELSGERDLMLKFRFNKPTNITDNAPYSYYFNSTLHKSEIANLPLDSSAWNKLEKLPEGTVAEAYITFNKLYETDEVFDIFRNKDLELLWLAVDTGVRDGDNTVLGFPHTQAFPELRKEWFSPTPAGIELYKNGKFRNEYFIDTLEFLKEYKAIANAVDPMADISGALDYVDKNGVKILGVAITGPTKEILKLREDNLVSLIIVGEARLWNWD